MTRVDTESRSSEARNARSLEVVGAGPAGLSAAISARLVGVETTVYEKNSDVGERFHGDFQGLENWTNERDVLEELAAMGIAATFEHHPVSEFVCFDPDGRDYRLRSADPVFYLIRRGSERGTLDQNLKEQALGAGAEIHFGQRRQHLPSGGVVAEGPHTADAIAAGYVFETDMPNGCYAAVAQRLAPQGYAYLLVQNGRGTVATCLYTDFHNERDYLARTIEFFRQHVGLRWQAARGFGGSAHFARSNTARRGALLYAGESAGFQDVLFGFGLRYAIVSGHLSGRAAARAEGERYDALWQARFDRYLRASVANRWLYSRFGDFGHRWVLATFVRGRDPRDFMRRLYGPQWFKDWLGGPLVPARLARAKRPKSNCDCTWCRAGRAP